MMRPWIKHRWNEAENRPGLTPVAWRAWGVVVLPFYVWYWACWRRADGWTIDGRLISLRRRVDEAWSMWGARYWWDV